MITISDATICIRLVMQPKYAHNLYDNLSNPILLDNCYIIINNKTIQSLMKEASN